MIELMSVVSLIVVVSSGAMVAYLFAQTSGRLRNRAAELRAIELPATVAERRRLMQEEGDDGETFAKIKRAAKLKTARPAEPFLSNALRRAGVSTDEAIGEFKLQIISYWIGGMTLGALLGAEIGLLLAGAAGGAVLGLSLPYQFLEHKAASRETQMRSALLHLVRPLIVTLDRGLDLTTTIKELTTRANGDSRLEPACSLLESALDSARAQGSDIRTVLPDVAFVSGSRSFTRLCFILGTSAKHGSGWRTHLEHFVLELEDNLGTKLSGIENSNATQIERFFSSKQDRLKD